MKSRSRDVDTFDALALVTSGDPSHHGPGDAGRRTTNPRWVPAISSATTASIGAHVGTHAAAEAARVVFRFGLWPAALDLWRIAPTDPRAKQWDAGALERRTADHAGIGAAVVAGDRGKGACAQFRDRRDGARFSRWAWSRATFPIGGQHMDGRYRCAGRAQGRRQIRAHRSLATSNFRPPSNNRFGTVYTSLCGTLVRIEIERATGALRIAKAYSVFECGEALVPEVVLGQAQGGFAMGVGYALLETLPPYEGGPGNGQWNLGQYLIARGSDLPLRDLEIEVLPPLTPDEPPKGMAEVVMIPVVPALLNAIFDATGHRFQSLPVTQTHAQGSAVVTTLRITINGRAYGPMDVRDDLTMNDFLRETLGHDRHQVRLRRCAMPELRGDRR